MSTSYSGKAKYSPMLLAAAAFSVIMLLLVYSLFSSATAQILSGCPAQDPQQKGWQKNTTVTYAIFKTPDAVFNDDAKDQIRAALAAWHFENQSNCMRVMFAEDPDNQNANIRIIATATGGVDQLSGVDTTTSITVYQDIRINVNLLDATRPNFYKKAVLHEVGHSMGLDDAPSPQLSGRTVMNNGYDVTPDSIQP